jgi:cell division protein ZapA
MPQVTLQIGDKTYRMACAEGEEPRIQALAAHFSARTDALAEQFPRMPADHLFLMAALLVTDELFEAREELQGTLKQIARLGSALNANDSSKGPTGSEMAQIVRDAGARLNKLGDPKRPDVAKGSAPPSGELKVEESTQAEKTQPPETEKADEPEVTKDSAAEPEEAGEGKLAKGTG